MTFFVRPMLPKDLFSLGELKENDKQAFTGDSVFIKKDRTIQGGINHAYQRVCLWLDIWLGLSPIRYICVVARENHGNSLIGVAWARYRDPENAIVGIYVQTEFRRAGVGCALVEELIKVSKTRRVNLWAFYDIENPAVNLMKKNGFKENGRGVKLKYESKMYKLRGRV